MAGQGEINEQLVDALLAHMGLYRHGGRKDNAGALLPLLIMDAHYILFTEKIASLTFDGPEYATERAGLLYARDKWHDAYNAFNKFHFRAWNKEQRDYVCDMMDSLGSVIHNDLMILQVSVANNLSHLEFEAQSVLSSCVVCNVLAIYAQDMWGVIFRKSNMEKKHNNRLQDIIDYSKQFEDRFYDTTLSAVNVNFNEDSQFNRSIDNIAMRIITWLKNYH